MDPERISAGMRLLVRSEAGGYDRDYGWMPESKRAVPEVQQPEVAPEPEASLDSDELSELSAAKSLDEHTDEVVAELDRILAGLRFDLSGCDEVLRRAARLHDWGKAHPVFQETLHKDDWTGERPDPLLAKQDRKKSRRKHRRAGFRHELASALAALESGEEFLTVYLIAAHHGKVRMNIRSVDAEKADGVRVARGVRDKDTVFAADLGGGVQFPATEMCLDPMEMGAHRWTDSALRLVEKFGPFRLAYLELLLRSADERASEENR